MESYALGKGIDLYRMGPCFDTGALVLPEGLLSLGQVDQIPGMTWNPGGPGFNLSGSLAPRDRFFGLGQAIGPLNRRGKVYESWATDDFSHTPEKKSLYGAHNFLIWEGQGEAWGLFIDHPGKITWDLGFTDSSQWSISWQESHFQILVIRAKDPLGVCRRFIRLTGETFAPPRWAFGYFQSRWAYPTEAAVRTVAQRMKDEGMPLEAIHLDIDYMDALKVFTLNSQGFPDMEALVKDLAPIKLIPILDPGVAAGKDYPVAEEGVAQGHFVTDAQGAPFLGAVWPGKSYFPDFRQEKVRDWWASWVQKLSKIGFGGYWVDMNEPALFYTPEGLKDLFDLVKQSQAKDNLRVEDFFALKDRAQGLSNNAKDYERMHQVDPVLGRVSHARVHNLYGHDMARATVQGLQAAQPGQRVLVYTRSSFTGTQRFAGMWTGDNASWWEHILLHLRTVTSLHLQGFLYCGPDIGGFTSNASAELVIRWTQVGVFTPLMRNHSCAGTREQEPYQFDTPSKRILKAHLELRYSLLTWLYSQFMIFRKKAQPFWRPLSFQYAGPEVEAAEDQILLGPGVLLTPVIHGGHQGRFVYLPEHPWLCLRFSSWDRIRAQVFSPGVHWVDIPLEEVCLFLAPGQALALTPPALNSTGVSPRHLKVLGFGAGKASLTLWDDDGITDGGPHSLTKITLKNEGPLLQVHIKEKTPVAHRIEFLEAKLYDFQGRMTQTRTR